MNPMTIVALIRAGTFALEAVQAGNEQQASDIMEKGIANFQAGATAWDDAAQPGDTDD